MRRVSIVHRAQEDPVPRLPVAVEEQRRTGDRGERVRVVEEVVERAVEEREAEHRVV